MSVDVLCDSSPQRHQLTIRLDRWVSLAPLSYLSLLILYTSVSIPAQLTNSRSTSKDSATMKDVNVSPAPLTLSPVKQLMAFQTQILQTTTQMANNLRQVVSEQVTTLQSNRNNAISSAPVTSATPLFSATDVEKLAAMQTLVLQQVSQLTVMSQQVLQGQTSTHCGPTKEQTIRTQDMQPEQTMKNQESCYCCKRSGLPCLQSKLSQDEATMKQTQMLPPSQKRKLPTQEQLIEDSFLPHAPSTNALQLMQGMPHPKNVGNC